MEPITATKRIYTQEELEKRVKKVDLNPGKPLELYQNAMSEGMSVSSFLEKLDPSDDADPLDAFGRQIAAQGIRTKSDPARGIFADKIDRFYASDQPVSIVLFPEFINREMRLTRLDQDYTSEIVAVTTPVDSDVYRSIYVDTGDITQWQMKRVSERTEIPTAKLVTKEQTIRLYKYGLRLEATYEAIRRMRIDQLRIHLQYIGLQTALDKLGTAVDVIVNGDGNSNAATADTTVGLDSTCPSGAITYKAWVSWLMNFYPYKATTVLGTKASLIKMLTMAFPGGDPLMLLAQYGNSSSGLQVELAEGIFTTVRLVISATAPANTLVGIDKGFGIEQLTEIGATLTETDKIISSQFNEIVLSEVVGYDKMYNSATRVLTIS